MCDRGGANPPAGNGRNGGSSSSDSDGSPNGNDNNGNRNNCRSPRPPLNPPFDEDPEDCCNTGHLRQAVSSNFQLEREIQHAGGALTAIREACQHRGVEPDHPSIANLQEAYDAAVSPESCWNRHGTTYHERALARFDNPDEFNRTQQVLSDALEEIQPHFGPPYSNSRFTWLDEDVPPRENTSLRRSDYELGVEQVICRDRIEPYLAAAAHQQQEAGAMGYGRYPQNIVSQAGFSQRFNRLPQSDPRVEEFQPLVAEMDYFDRQRDEFASEVETQACSRCIRGLDPDYDGYTMEEERELNAELRADPGRCRRNELIAKQLTRSRALGFRDGNGPAPGSRELPDHEDDLFQAIGHVPRTLSNDEVEARVQSGHVWNRPTTCPPDDGRYDGLQAHPTECLCARVPNCDCSGCRSDRENQDRRAIAIRDERLANRRPPGPSGSGVCGPRRAGRGRAQACDSGPLGARPDTPLRPGPGCQRRQRGPCPAAAGADPAGEETMVINPCDEQTMVMDQGEGDETLVIDMAAEAEAAEAAAARAQEAAAAAEAARIAAEEASDARLRAIRAQHLAARKAGRPVAASRDFSTIPTTRPDTPRASRNRCGRRPAAAAAAPAEPQAGLEEALRAEQVAAAAAAETANEARLRCVRAKHLADKADKASRAPTRRSERVKRKRIADTGVAEPECQPGCKCADCTAAQQGPSKRPPRGAGGGSGGAGGCGGGSGVSA